VKRFLTACCFLLLAAISYGQSKPKPAVKPALPALKKLLTGSGLPFQFINDSLAVIPYEGENIASYNVIVQGLGDLYIVYVDLSEALPGKMDDTKYKYLLQRNNDFDFIKIGLDNSDNTVSIRADVLKTGVTASTIARIIKQVANVTNIIGGDLK
jgi:hypothetical protein